MIYDIRQSIRHLNRYQEIIRIFIKYGFWDVISKIKIGLIPDIAKKIIPQSEEKDISALSTPVRIRMAFEELGATFIKLGQMLSSRPDMIPPEIAQELSGLQDQVAAEDFVKIKETLEAELGGVLDDIFDSFDEKAIAAASIAQVYKAKIKTGQTVAVKILRSNLKIKISTDIDILKNFAALIEKYIPESRLYNPSGIVKEFEKTLKKEQNLALEGRNIDTFRNYSADDKTIRIPKVYWDYTREKILVTEFINGVKITDFGNMKNSELDRRQIALNCAQSLLKQIFEYGFFHADPHPGNLFVLPGNIIAPVDFGMMGRIDEEMKDDLQNILRGIVEKDVYRITHVLLKIGMIEDRIDTRALHRDLLDYLDRYHSIPLNKLNASTILNEFMEIIQEFQIKLPPDLVMMGRALVMEEAIGEKLDPEFNLFELLVPYAQKTMLESINPLNTYRKTFRTIEQGAALMNDLPEDLKFLMNKLKNDKLKLNLEHLGIEKLSRDIDKSSNRLSFSLIIAALIIGSSLIIREGSGPTIFDYPAFGIIGYSLASILGIWLIISILRSGKL